MSDEYAQLFKVVGLITLLLILITPDKSILFANPGVDQHLILGINVGHVKGTGKRFLAVYLGGLPCPNPSLSKVSSAAAFRKGPQGLARQFFPHPASLRGRVSFWELSLQFCSRLESWPTYLWAPDASPVWSIHVGTEWLSTRGSEKPCRNALGPGQTGRPLRPRCTGLTTRVLCGPLSLLWHLLLLGALFPAGQIQQLRFLGNWEWADEAERRPRVPPGFLL